ncbi:hypothetical protein CEXT_10981 [Caerostris extrusa]|uniref:Uncharacterized protein n=1 Tax=Caerostris extrusa TaxID=172846 RepID=A0AAV4PG49_CAEEX|nr:hypothetical protein CEXT_10981 [Caerostris extrusa]
MWLPCENPDSYELKVCREIQATKKKKKKEVDGSHKKKKIKSLDPTWDIVQFPKTESPSDANGHPKLRELRKPR